MGSKRIPQAYGAALAGIERRRSTRVRAPTTPTLRPSTIRTVSGSAVRDRDPPPRDIPRKKLRILSRFFALPYAKNPKAI